MEELMIDQLWTLLTGAGGATVILATFMGYIKTLWKPKEKWKYWLVASPASLVITGAIMWYVSFWNFWIFILISILVAAAQLIENNEMWPLVKKIFYIVLKRTGGSRKTLEDSEDSSEE